MSVDKTKHDPNDNVKCCSFSLSALSVVLHSIRKNHTLLPSFAFFLCFTNQFSLHATTWYETTRTSDVNTLYRPRFHVSKSLWTLSFTSTWPRVSYASIKMHTLSVWQRLSNQPSLQRHMVTTCWPLLSLCSTDQPFFPQSNATFWWCPISSKRLLSFPPPLTKQNRHELNRSGKIRMRFSHYSFRCKRVHRRCRFRRSQVQDLLSLTTMAFWPDHLWIYSNQKRVYKLAVCDRESKASCLVEHDSTR